MEHAESLIVEQLKIGNEVAYKYLYDVHYPILCQIASQYLKDDFLAETIVGDVIFHLWEIRETLSISTSIRSYLSKSVRNRCLDYIKSQYNKKMMNVSSLKDDTTRQNSFMLSDNYPLGSLLEKELEEKIYDAIKRMPEESRTVFTKSRFEDMKREDIAKELNISVNTVKYHLKKALAYLSEELSEYMIILIIIVFFTTLY